MTSVLTQVQTSRFAYFSFPLLFPILHRHLFAAPLHHSLSASSPSYFHRATSFLRGSVCAPCTRRLSLLLGRFFT
uniref:Uncharacterized protein n=1 Tax=Leishmania guyanensis TaxID=5670 RepID=A0A1E1ITN3_LEIGU|nr:Hypothetical protein BN36_1112040 [Leishmania guyanensis]